MADRRFTRTARDVVGVGLLAVAASGCGDVQYGQPQVTGFKGGRLAAFSLQLDDSTESQVANALPALKARGLVATFYATPGTERYEKHREVWEVEVPAAGHELGDHTMTHTDTDTYARADSEIGGAARVIRQAYGGAPRLLTYIRPGGVRWGITNAEEAEILDRHEAVYAPRTHRYPSSDQTDITYPVRDAIERRTWNQIGFHGIGGDWLSTDTADFVRLLDFLVAQRASVWTATTAAVYKYWKESTSLRSATLSDATATGFSVAVLCDETQVKTFGRPFAELYDEPLTVRVSVPESWSAFTVTQGQESQRYDVVTIDGARVAEFDVRPNRDAARVTKL